MVYWFGKEGLAVIFVALLVGAIWAIGGLFADIQSLIMQLFGM